MRERVGVRSTADVLHQYERDRFVRPAALDPLQLMRIETQALAACVPPFEPVQLAPLAPFGAHAVVAGVDQHRVVTTVRGSEVVADPTNVLALEAAVRRRAIATSDPRSPRTVRLAAVSRVVRAQQFEAPNAFPHFSLLGMVSAGRDIGNHAFEVEACLEHLTTLQRVIEVADGGMVDWTEHLVASKKERLMISGLGLERIALAGD